MPEDLAESATAVFTTTRFPDIQGPGHAIVTGSLVGEADDRIVIDRDLTEGEQNIVLNFTAWLRTLEVQDLGSSAVVAAFESISNGTFLAFALYAGGKIDGQAGLDSLANVYEAFAALAQMYSDDPLREMRDNEAARTAALQALVEDE